jgi:hypothetical protein
MTTENLLLSTIYHYKPKEDRWALLDARLKEGKRNVIAMLVDKEMLDVEKSWFFDWNGLEWGEIALAWRQLKENNFSFPLVYRLIAVVVRILLEW